jgi:hypothetical protein
MKLIPYILIIIAELSVSLSIKERTILFICYFFSGLLIEKMNPYDGNKLK